MANTSYLTLWQNFFARLAEDTSPSQMSSPRFINISAVCDTLGACAIVAPVQIKLKVLSDAAAQIDRGLYSTAEIDWMVEDQFPSWPTTVNTSHAMELEPSQLTQMKKTGSIWIK